MSAAEIINHLPNLTEPEMRQVRQRLLELTAQNREVGLCNQSALEGAQLLDQLEDEDARSPAR